MPNCLRPVFLAADIERATDIVAPGVTRGRLLCQRLYRRVDREVDGETDVDLRAAYVDPVRAITIARQRSLWFHRCGGIGEIQRSRRAMQRLQRLQHDA